MPVFIMLNNNISAAPEYMLNYTIEYWDSKLINVFYIILCHKGSKNHSKHKEK
jgi:hypothetical protein